MELVTGHAGEDHISAADIASMLRGIYSDTDVVLPVDDELEITILSANSVQVGKGGCMLQGHYARVETAEQLVIESGSVGYKRNDLVIARYELGTGNVQSVTLAVVKGTPTTQDTATDPDIQDGVIDDGDILVEFALWRIPIDGVNVGTPERIMPTVDTLQGQIASVRESVAWAAISSDIKKVELYKSNARPLQVRITHSNDKQYVLNITDTGMGLWSTSDGRYLWTINP